MNAETLKDFFISLGFKVDDSGARKFDAIVTGATLKAITVSNDVTAGGKSLMTHKHGGVEHGNDSTGEPQ